jgi:DNA-binding CsgD family transcriptional regulator
MSYRNFQSDGQKFGAVPASLMAFDERQAIDQAIDRIYAAAVQRMRPDAFVSVLASLVVADDVLLESGPRPKATALRAQTPHVIVVDLPKSDTDFETAVFMRNDLSAEFEPMHRALLMRLAPHIARALSIRSSLQHKASPDQDREIDHEALQSVFRLAPSHARLLALLVRGHQVKTAAQQLGVTEGSARQYLKKIFEKTGARRQMDLIRLADRALSRHEI